MSDDDHDYRTCGDRDCERYPCRIYKEGYANGRDDGYFAGYADGEAAGQATAAAAG